MLLTVQGAAARFSSIPIGPAAMPRFADPERLGPGDAIGAPEQLDDGSGIAIGGPARRNGLEGKLGGEGDVCCRIGALRQPETLGLVPAPALDESARSILPRRGGTGERRATAEKDTGGGAGSQAQ